MPANVSQLQKAKGVGTALEFGLPLLVGPGGGVVGGLARAGAFGTGSMIGEALGASGKTPSTQRLMNVGMESTALGLLGEGVGGGINKGIQKFASPFSKSVEPATLAAAKKMGIKYTPSEVLSEDKLGPSLLQGIEKVTGSMVGGGAVLNPLRAGRLGAIKKHISGELDKLITSLDDPLVVRGVAEEGLESSKKVFSQWNDKLFGTLDKSAEAAGRAGRVPMDRFRKAAESILKSIPESERVAAGKSSREVASLLGQLQRAQSLPTGTISFADARFQRSLLLDQIRSADSPISKRLIGASKKLVSVLDDEMRATATRGGFIGEFEVANRFYSTALPKFENAVIKRLAEVEPGKLAGEIIKPNNAESIKQIRAVIGESAFDKIRRRGLQDFVESSMSNDKGGDFLNGKDLVSKWRKLGPETKNVAYSMKEQADIDEIFNTIAKFDTQKQQPGLWGMSQTTDLLTGAAFMSGGAAIGGSMLGPAGAIGGAALGGAGVTLGPAAFAKMITSDRGRKWLTEGFKIKPGTKEAINFMSRFSAWLAKENLTER
jgi:hypothetical protein